MWQRNGKPEFALQIQVLFIYIFWELFWKFRKVFRNLRFGHCRQPRGPKGLFRKWLPHLRFLPHQYRYRLLNLINTVVFRIFGGRYTGFFFKNSAR